MDDLSACPFVVDEPVMLHRWERLAFLHWSFEPEIVQQLLPKWLTAETVEGRAWVGLVPFFMRVATGGGRRVPWVSHFCETNVRTYVRDDEGRSGIWFFSLDAARLPAVLTARATYGLPYYWSRMRIASNPGEVSYFCNRLWPEPRARSRVRLRIGEPFGASELSERDHFLTARWVLFSSTRRRRRFASAQHDPWPLRRATTLEVDDGLLPAAGLPRPTDEPIVHYSDGVDVRIGRPIRYPSPLRRADHLDPRAARSGRRTNR